MSKQVIMFGRKGCQACEQILFELEQVRQIKPLYFDNLANEAVFREFSHNFKISRYPTVQIDDGNGIITLHRDPDFDISKVHESLKTDDFKFYFCPTIEVHLNLIEEFLKD